MNQIRMLIVDDHEMVRAGIRHLLGSAKDIQVVGEAGDGEEAIRLVAELRPDLVLLDAKMPVLDGIEATRRLKQSRRDLFVIILTSYEDDYLLSGIEAGADGYLVKDIRGPELAEAIRMVASGSPYIAPRIQRRLLDTLADFARRDQPHTLLTERQLAVLRLLVSGLTNARIATSLSVSETTVKREFQAIFAKLNVQDRASAIHEACKRKLI
jgi:DNA-binding NarL/FixJ family response regulator